MRAAASRFPPRTAGWRPAIAAPFLPAPRAGTRPCQVLLVSVVDQLQGLGRAVPDSGLDRGALALSRAGIGHGDLALARHREDLRGLQLAHRVALAQVQVDLDPHLPGLI